MMRTRLCRPSLISCNRSRAPFLLLLVLLLLAARPDLVRAQGVAAKPERSGALSSFAPIAGAVYESTFRKDNVEIFSPDGLFLGLVGKIGRPTGLVFDAAGNLFVASDDSAAGYSIKKVLAADGKVTTFSTAALSGPHGLAIDQAGNLYVANNNNNTVAKYTPSGTATVFASRDEGLVNPIGLVFDLGGNLFVTNTHGGPQRSGRVIRLSPDGVSTIFASGGLETPYGIAIDSAGNVYVSLNGGNRIDKFAADGTYLGVFCNTILNAPNGILFDDEGNLLVANNNTATIEKFAPDGSYLGVFAHTRNGPHFLAIYHPQ